jgi:UDP-2,3-diacylglucosamine hydrolase
MKAVFFISDLHLHPHRPELLSLFEEFLQKAAARIGSLYILGDFLEAYVGDDDPSYHSIGQLLSQYNQQFPIYLMAGNRDFLLGSGFAKLSGCTLLADPTVVTLFGLPILLMHGDSLCTSDKAYQRYRRVTRLPLLQSLFLKLPLSFRQKVAKKLRQNSRNQYQNTPIARRDIDVCQSAVTQEMQKHQVATLIHGHVHKPGQHCFTLNEKPVQRWVLGDWGEHASVLIVTPEQKWQLMALSFNDMNQLTELSS